MDQVARYRELIVHAIEEYAAYKPFYGDVQREVVIDPVRDHYQLVSVGWNGDQRIHGCLLHVDLKDGKIWVQYDGTEGGIATRLVEAGVPKQDIVLAFQSPFRRRFTEFAVG